MLENDHRSAHSSRCVYLCGVGGLRHSVGGVENEMDEEIDGGELGDGIGRIIGEEEITALRSLHDVGKHALHNSEEITTREL